MSDISEFQLGDLVRLKSGSRLMTVVSFYGGRIQVERQEPSGHFTRTEYPPQALVRDPANELFEEFMERLSEK